MKVLAIIDVKPGADLESLRRQLPHEVKGSWDLFAAGVLREAYATPMPSRVVFVLEAENAAAAEVRASVISDQLGGNSLFERRLRA